MAMFEELMAERKQLESAATGKGEAAPVSSSTTAGASETNAMYVFFIHSFNSHTSRFCRSDLESSDTATSTTKITEVYDFAGEEVKLNKMNDFCEKLNFSELRKKFR